MNIGSKEEHECSIAHCVGVQAGMGCNGCAGSVASRGLPPGEQEEAFLQGGWQHHRYHIVVSLLEIVDAKATGTRADCTDNRVLKGCLGCPLNAQQAYLLLLFVQNTNTMGAVLGSGRNQHELFLKSGCSTFPWKSSQKRLKAVKLKEKHLRIKTFNVFWRTLESLK